MSTPVGPPRDTRGQGFEPVGNDDGHRLVHPADHLEESPGSGPQIGYGDTRPERPQNTELQREVRDNRVAPPPATTVAEPLHGSPVAPPVLPVSPDRETVLARERERFGGMKFGAAFFGWLAATGLAVLLLAILAAAGVAFGITNTDNVNQAVQQANQATGTAKTVSLIGAIVLLVILFLAYYAGGYVAGRMARFDGFRQGLGVWLWAIITTAVIAAVAAIAGSKYNILANLNLPRIPVKEGAVTTVGIIAIAAALLAALLGALLGGKVGTSYHRKVDAAGYLDE